MTSSFTERMIGAAMLNVAIYEEVEHDESATGQAAVVVVLAAIASAIGSAGEGVGAALAGLLSALFGWLLWAGVTYFVGTKLFGGIATWGELLRTLGFAQAPRLLLVAAIVPILGVLVALVVAIWSIVAAVIAVRQALDVDTAKAIFTILVSLVVVILIMIPIGIIFGIGGMMFG
jgi:hypothetical protein